MPSVTRDAVPCAWSYVAETNGAVAHQEVAVLAEAPFQVGDLREQEARRHGRVAGPTAAAIGLVLWDRARSSVHPLGLGCLQRPVQAVDFLARLVQLRRQLLDGGCWI